MSAKAAIPLDKPAIRRWSFLSQIPTRMSSEFPGAALAWAISELPGFRGKTPENGAVLRKLKVGVAIGIRPAFVRGLGDSARIRAGAALANRERLGHALACHGDSVSRRSSNLHRLGL
mgnify:CR=1 FL=1